MRDLYVALTELQTILREKNHGWLACNIDPSARPEVALKNVNMVLDLLILRPPRTLDQRESIYSHIHRCIISIQAVL